ncbi:hypothetical protein H5410_036072 [Solanum commersonii]|uniref:Uncharacterized protein n=1 Tax=Solanum commersonii TaxID=4109 RepID=A0A9J5Y5F6_SOLCO|nr:hypothetical protein H5410_036072 [Solanum commersonii]
MGLHKRHHYSFITLMKQLQMSLELDKYSRKLGFDKARVNCIGKNWYFWKYEWEGRVILDTLHEVTVQFRNNIKEFIISAVNVRSNALERLEIGALSEVRISCCKYTLWNDGIEEAFIFKRLDRILVNQEFMNLFPSSKVQHLIRQGIAENRSITLLPIYFSMISDDQDNSRHAPLHMIRNTKEEPSIKPFKFLNF